MFSVNQIILFFKTVSKRTFLKAELGRHAHLNEKNKGA